MSLTDRDRKIVMILVPLVVVLAYWFLLLTPKREEATTAATELTTQEERRDAAQMRVDSLDRDRTDFAAAYAEMVRLGKAVPATVDMPTLLVQLEAAAQGTDIDFMAIKAEEREAAPVPVATPPAAPGTGDGSQGAVPGGAPAQSAPGQAAESAGNAVTAASANNAAAAQQSGVNPADTQTSETAREGGLPVGGGAVTPGAPAAAGAAAPPALDTVPLTLDFTGNFFDLASFFHRLKRYVKTSKNSVLVEGRLLTVDGVEFTSTPESFPRITATLTATAYLAPKSEGAMAGATPGGPAVTPASTGTPAPTTPAPVAPTATATR